MTTLGREAITTVDLIVAQGADQSYAVRYSTSDGTTTTPVDLTDWSARAQLRRKVGGDIWLDLTDTDGIALTADGLVTVTIDHTTTEDPAWNAYSRVTSDGPQTLGVWDLELISPDGRVTRLVQGTVTVSPDVTRSQA